MAAQNDVTEEEGQCRLWLACRGWADIEGGKAIGCAEKMKVELHLSTEEAR